MNYDVIYRSITEPLNTEFINMLGGGDNPLLLIYDFASALVQLLLFILQVFVIVWF